MAVLDFAQAATPWPCHPHRLPTGRGKPRRIEHQHPIALAHVRLDVAPQLLSPGGIVPRIPTKEALQRQARLAKTRGNRCDVFALDVRQQAADRGFGVLSSRLTLEDTHQGLHESGEAWNDLLENLWGTLTFVKQLAFAQGISRFPGTLLL